MPEQFAKFGRNTRDVHETF